MTAVDTIRHEVQAGVSPIVMRGGSRAAIDCQATLGVDTKKTPHAAPSRSRRLIMTTRCPPRAHGTVRTVPRPARAAGGTATSRAGMHRTAAGGTTDRCRPRAARRSRRTVRSEERETSGGVCRGGQGPARGARPRSPRQLRTGGSRDRSVETPGNRRLSGTRASIAGGCTVCRFSTMN